MVLIIFTFLNFLMIANSHSINTDNLVALVQIFRHGERTPMIIYPKNPFKNYWNELGTEQMTNRGRRQLHTLGQYTRSRYSEWIPKKYNRTFVYAQTTDSDRTHISGQSFLYGLFPATGDQKWLPNTDWQAIPLHVADPIKLHSSFTSCPVYDMLYAKLVTESDDFIKINKEYADLYAYLTNHTGENITELHRAEMIWDSFRIEKGVGLNLPEWSKTIYPEPLRTLQGVWMNSLTYTTRFLRFYTGPLLNDLVNYFHSMATNSSTSSKYQIYSAHDDNIIAILKSFGAFENPYPIDFASSLWMELRKSSSSYYINVWFKNGEELSQIPIKNCDLDCPLEDISGFLKDVLVDADNWVEECNSERELKKLSK